MARINRPLRIALLTPYSGANLGDGAIHDAIIGNLPEYREDIEFVSIVGEPRAVSGIHGIPAITMTGKHGSMASIRHVTRETASGEPGSSSPRSTVDPAGGAEPAASPKPRWLNRAWRAAKKLPVLGRILTTLIGAARKIWEWRFEPEHLVRSVLHTCRFDLILVCGGGQLDDSWGGAWAHPYVLFRWAIIAKLTRTPYAIASVGVGSMSSRLSRFFIRTACSCADYRSFRDVGSRERLSNWSFTQQDPIVPDFAYSLPVSGQQASRKPNPMHRIAVSPIRCGAHRGAEPDQERVYRKYITTLARFSLSAMDSAHDVVFFTSSLDDTVALEDLLTEIRRHRAASDQTNFVTLPSQESATLVTALSNVDIVVASRLHSVILAQRAGCAALAISFDRKVDAHISLFRQQEYLLDVSRLTLESLTARNQDLLDNLVAVRAAVFERTERLASQVQEQYPALIKLAEASA